jgi:hypothetical protein
MIGQPGFDCPNSLVKKFLPLVRLEHANALRLRLIDQFAASIRAFHRKVSMAQSQVTYSLSIPGCFLLLRTSVAGLRQLDPVNLYRFSHWQIISLSRGVLILVQHSADQYANFSS